MACARLRGFPFVLPYLPFLLVFGIAPMIYAVDLAVHQWRGRAGRASTTSASTATDFRFLPALKHVLVYTVIWLSLLAVFVVTLALLLHGRANKVSTSYRFLFYIPGALAGAASVLVWLFMLDPSVSPGSSWI